MKRIIAITVMASFVIIAGCASPTKIVIASGYKKQSAAGNLAVVINDSAPEAIYFGDVRRSLGKPGRDRDSASDEAILWDFFREQLMRDIAKEIDVKAAFFAEVKHKYFVTKDAVSTSDEDVTIEIPEEKTRFTFFSDNAALVLFLDKVRVGTETDPYYQERAQAGVYATAPRRLVYMASFVLWDNQELKPICYGRVRTDTPITREEAAIADWEEISRDFVRAIFGPAGLVKGKGKDK
jgi:hypothetical protein